MTITKGSALKNLILYPPAKPNLLTENCQPCPYRYHEECLHSPLTLDETLRFKNQTEDDVINGFINKPSAIGNPTCQIIKAILDNESHEDPLGNSSGDHIPTTIVHNSMPIKIEPDKNLNINAIMDNQQQEKSIEILHKYKQAFAWIIQT